MALLCGLSRIQDNKHHPRDVTVGFLIGAFVAIAVVSTFHFKIHYWKLVFLSETENRKAVSREELRVLNEQSPT